MPDSSIPVNPATGGTLAPIDIRTVTTGVGTVDRQVVVIGDPTTGSQELFVSATGTIGVTITDGAQATIGAQADAAYTTGTGSVVSILKGIFAKVAGTLTATITGALPAGANAIGSVSVSNLPATQPVSGTVTANAGTNLNTSTLALESGGHLATVDTSTAATSTATGTQADAAYTTGSGSIVALLKGIFTRLRGGSATAANSLPVVIASDQSTIPVSGTFWQATQPVSIATMPSTPVTGTFWQGTQPVSGTITTVGSVASGSPDSGNPVKVGAKYNAAAPTLTDGYRTDLQTDIYGNLKVINAGKQAGEDLVNDVMKVRQVMSYAHIATAATTVVKSGAGYLQSLTINQTAAGTITIYDSTTASGTVIAVLKASNAEQTFFYQVAFSTGLTIVTVAASDLTVAYA